MAANVDDLRRGLPHGLPARLTSSAVGRGRLERGVFDHQRGADPAAAGRTPAGGAHRGRAPSPSARVPIAVTARAAEASRDRVVAIDRGRRAAGDARRAARSSHGGDRWPCPRVARGQGRLRAGRRSVRRRDELPHRRASARGRRRGRAGSRRRVAQRGSVAVSRRHPRAARGVPDPPRRRPREQSRAITVTRRRGGDRVAREGGWAIRPWGSA